jgi:hypothetical protein
MKNKLKELIHKKKVSEDNITFLTKKYVIFLNNSEKRFLKYILKLDLS